MILAALGPYHAIMAECHCQFGVGISPTQRSSRSRNTDGAWSLRRTGERCACRMHPVAALDERHWRVEIDWIGILAGARHEGGVQPRSEERRVGKEGVGPCRSR